MRAISTIDDFLDDVRGAADRAATHTTHELRLSVAGHAVRVRFAGVALADAYAPALTHLAAPVGPSHQPFDLSVVAWERSATGVPPPAPPWPIEDFLPRGRIRGLVQDRIRVTYDDWARTLTVYDREAGEAFVHVATAAEIPTWVTRSPLRNVLTWWAGDRGLAFLHASAVAESTGAVALAGASGSGKSTTALACFAAGMRLIGDDACIARSGPDPVLFPVYGLAKLERDALDRLPELRAHVVDHDAEQLLVAPPGPTAQAATLRAVLLARLAGTPYTRVTEVPAKQALRRLVAGSLLEGDGAGGTALRALTRLVQDVPCYDLGLGTERDGIVGTIQEVVRAA